MTLPRTTRVGVRSSSRVDQVVGKNNGRRRGAKVEQFQLELGALSVGSAVPSRRGSTGAVARTERFEVDGHRRVFRLVARRPTGEIVRTFVARLPKGISKKDVSATYLAALADEWYLTNGTHPLLDDTGIGKEAGEIRVVDIFGGCGAMSLGIAEACRALGLRFRMVGAFEIDDAALAVFGRNFGGPEPKRDVEQILSPRFRNKPTRRERELMREFGQVDFVVAGPPCQGHSNLNNRTRRADPKNELYFRVARFVRLFEPRWVLIENVPAVRHDGRNVVGRTRRALEELGYVVDDAVVRLADLGVPQTRRRHVLVAMRQQGREETITGIPTVAEMVERFRVPRREVVWAIGDLEERQPGDLFDTAAKPSAETRRRIEWLFENDAYELDNAQRPLCQRGEHRYIGVYGRMRPWEPGPTITGGYDTMGRGRFVHPTQPRTITPHEAARIQFFPDRFDFTPATRARARLAQVIGNAVPPKLSYAVALELMR